MLLHMTISRRLPIFLKLIQEQIYKADNANQNVSRVGGEFREMDELHMYMRQREDDFATEITAEQDCQHERVVKKDKFGRELMN